jgi:hypothetical protein
MRGLGEPGAVLSCRDDDLKVPARVQDRLGEELVSTVREVADSDQVTVPVVGQLVADGLVDEPFGGGRESAVPGDRYPHQFARVV